MKFEMKSNNFEKLYTSIKKTFEELAGVYSIAQDLIDSHKKCVAKLNEIENLIIEIEIKK